MKHAGIAQRKSGARAVTGPRAQVGGSSPPPRSKSSVSRKRNAEPQQAARRLAQAWNANDGLKAALQTLVGLVDAWRSSGRPPELDALSVACSSARRAIDVSEAAR